MQSVVYRGATECDFRPVYTLTDSTAVSLAESVFDLEMGDFTTPLILADRLEELEDERHLLVREAVELEEIAASFKLTVEHTDWTHDQRLEQFKELSQTVRGWKLLGLYGVLCARWSPPPDGRHQYKTWVDARVSAVNRWLWMWSAGLTSDKQTNAARNQANAARSQANAAWSQTYAAWSQADAAWSQADAARYQAYAARYQAYAAWSQANAAVYQANAAGYQADAAGSQANAAGDQADAAGSQAIAAGSQANAAGSQAIAAGYQANAAWNLSLTWQREFYKVVKQKA